MDSPKPTSAPERFEHTPLDPTKKQIRLFQIQQSPCGIKGTMAIFDSAIAPAYTALSYTWGADLDTTDIAINGKPFGIRKNLLAFFEHYQQLVSQWVPWLTTFIRTGSFLSLGAYFWIDALCIDQTNTPERNKLVRSMDDIYSDASCVLTWLGPCNAPELQSAIDIIASPLERTIDWIYNKLYLGNLICWLLFPNPKLLAQQCAKVVPKGVSVDWSIEPKKRPIYATRIARPDVAPAARTFFNLGYWGRLWIIQELLLSRKVEIMLGTEIVPWPWVDSFIEEYPRRHETGDPQLVLGPCQDEHLRDLVHIRKTYSTANLTRAGSKRFTLDLRHALTSFLKSDCQDSRDHVFGLMGLVIPDERVEIDYSLEPLGVFYNVCRNLVADACLRFTKGHAGGANAASIRLKARNDAAWETIAQVSRRMNCSLFPEKLEELKDFGRNCREYLSNHYSSQAEVTQLWHEGDDKEFDNFYGPNPGSHAAVAASSQSIVEAGTGRLEVSGNIDWSTVHQIEFQGTMIPVTEEGGHKFIELFGIKMMII